MSIRFVFLSLSVFEISYKSCMIAYIFVGWAVLVGRGELSKCGMINATIRIDIQIYRVKLLSLFGLTEYMLE